MKKVQTIILTNIQAMMTGVWRIDRAHNLVKLTYTDGTTEACMIPLAKWKDLETPFHIVGYIQGQRARKETDAIPCYIESGKGQP